MATSPTQSLARPGYNSRYRSNPRGGATVAGQFATPGFVSPFQQGGGIRTDAMNSGTAANRALMGMTQPVQGGFNAKFGGIGPSGPRIDARAQLSPATGRGLADFYANQALPSEWDRLQQRAEVQQGWMDGGWQETGDSSQFGENLGLGATQGAVGASQPSQGFTPRTGAGSFLQWKPQSTAQTFPKIPWRAKGGSVKNIQPYIVNEEGMEAYQPEGGLAELIPGPMQMFIPPKDGKIIPHGKTKQMAKEGKILPPQFRATGGAVRGSQVFPFAGQSASNPWAVKWAMNRAQPQYESLYQQGVNQGVDMTNAPTNTSALRRYLQMGRRSQSAHASGTEAVQTLERERFQNYVPDRVRQPIFYYGEGGVTTKPEPSLFANANGEMLPWTAPLDAPWQTTWQQDNLLRQTRARRGNRRLPTFEETSFTVEDIQ